MITMNEDTLTIEISETFSWSHIEPVLADIVDNIYCNDVEDEASKKLIEEMKSWADMKKFEGFTNLPKDSKIGIMNCIKEKFEEEMYSDCMFNYNPSIFDTEIIQEGIYNWFDEHYNFDIRNF